MIGPPRQAERRPFWSVMIPVYNRITYLEATLKSVLDQDPGAEEMQIEVIDDASTEADPEPLVRRLGGSRVGFVRHPRNVGLVANFNCCVERSVGQWVHILHSDDLVLPGFYQRLRVGVETRSNIAAALCRWAAMDEAGNRRAASPPDMERPGVLDRGWVERLLVSNGLRTPAIVVRRSVYEQIGGYDLRLHFTSDWDMWKRIAVQYPVWYEPAILACHREHAGSETSRLMSAGRDMKDFRRSISLTERRLPRHCAKQLSKQARQCCALGAAWRAHEMLNKRDYGAAAVMASEALKTSCSVAVLTVLGRLLLRGPLALVGRALRACRLRG
jgi:hypothetical protein